MAENQEQERIAEARMCDWHDCFMPAFYRVGKLYACGIHLESVRAYDAQTARQHGQEQERRELEQAAAAQAVQERAASAPLQCVHGGPFTVGYDAAIGYFPRYWSVVGEEGFRAVMSIGYFELVVLAFPTYQEALQWVYSQA